MLQHCNSCTFHCGHKLYLSVRICGENFVEPLQILICVISLKERNRKQGGLTSLWFLEKRIRHARAERKKAHISPKTSNTGVLWQSCAGMGADKILIPVPLRHDSIFQQHSPMTWRHCIDKSYWLALRHMIRFGTGSPLPSSVLFLLRCTPYSVTYGSCWWLSPFLIIILLMHDVPTLPNSTCESFLSAAEKPDLPWVQLGSL